MPRLHAMETMTMNATSTEIAPTVTKSGRSLTYRNWLARARAAAAWSALARSSSVSTRTLSLASAL